jgi:hypothetical protein
MGLGVGGDDALGSEGARHTTRHTHGREVRSEVSGGCAERGQPTLGPYTAFSSVFGYDSFIAK